MEPCSMSCGSPGWEGVCGRMDTCICMAESVHHSPETITTLLIGYTPIQNAFGVLKKIKKNNNNKKYLHKKKTCDML